MYNQINLAQLLALRMGQLSESGKLDPVCISVAKRNNVSMALDVARNARSILGANGIVDDYGVMRHMCNLETVITYEGTHDIHTLIVGERLTGLSAFTN
jgi:alkylation response protein AidB-like acyl-CoA dehydrogenase